MATDLRFAFLGKQGVWGRVAPTKKNAFLIPRWEEASNGWDLGRGSDFAFPTTAEFACACECSAIFLSSY